MIKTEIKQKIMACADELVASGINEPTNDQVRERLGGGSLSHISPVMREWRGNRKDAVVVALDMPTELKNVVELSLTQIWTVATKIAFSDLENTKRESEKTVADVSLERDEALDEIQKLEKSIGVLEIESLSKTELIQKLEQANKELSSELINVTKEKESQLMILEDRRLQIAELNNSIKELQSELIQLAKTAKK